VFRLLVADRRADGRARLLSLLLKLASMIVLRCVRRGLEGWKDEEIEGTGEW
jgi:hypothetical protein